MNDESFSCTRPLLPYSPDDTTRTRSYFRINYYVIAIRRPRCFAAMTLAHRLIGGAVKGLRRDLYVHMNYNAVGRQMKTKTVR